MTGHLILVQKSKFSLTHIIYFLSHRQQIFSSGSSNISAARERKWEKHAVTEGNYLSFSFRIDKLIINTKLL